MTALPARRPEATMREVAMLAGVSVKTVSRVINGQGGAGNAVVQRVLTAAQTLGYRPNLTASSLRRTDRRSSTIGVLLEDLSNPFDSALLRGIEQRARESGVLVLAGSGEDDMRLQQELLASLASRRVDGVVVMAANGPQDALQQERQRGTPMVLVDRPPTFAHTDSVTTTNRQSTTEAIAQLAALGHRHIAYLGDRRALWTSQERYTGYIESIASAGLRLRPELIRTDLRGTDAAAQATLDVLTTAEPPTAIFAAQNLLTAGAMRALKERGMQHRVALIGFDDFPLADMVDPPVTVIRQDLPRLGHAATDLILARINGDDAPPVHQVVAASLVRRRSGEIRPVQH